MTGLVTLQPHRHGSPSRDVALPGVPLGEPRLRPARLDEAAAISALIAPFAAAGRMLPKSPDQIASAIHRYRVAVLEGRVVGSAASRPVNDRSAEVTALAVAPEVQGRGLGRALIGAILDDLRAEGFTRAFALTLSPRLFEASGFRAGRHHEVPEKIRLDCVRCPRRVGCPERMMILDDLGGTESAS